MKYRYATVHPAESLSAAGTKTIDLRLTEPISRLDIRFHITAVGYVMSAHPAVDITKIELVDGSDVLHSLTGYENQALAIYSRRAPTMCHGQHYNGNAEVTLYGIDFGRFLWDPQLALLTTQFKNPQLKISYTLTGCYASGTAGQLEVFAHVFDEKMISPMGFLMAKEHYSYTCGAENSYENIQLPRDYPIRKLLLRAYEAAREPWRIVSEVRLDEDNLKRIPLDVNTENYHRMMKGVLPVVTEQIIGYTNGSTTVLYLTPTDYYNIMLATLIDSDEPIKFDTWQPGGKFTVKAAGAASFMGVAYGYLPNHCFEFPFGDPQDPEDWYDVEKLASLRLRNKAGASGTSGTSQVVLEQLRRY